mmetsp:Transcript_24377/g.39144  ORF Transcript_24377/g.39144 Transcript_24377/m.39144 type:complete len:121 (-) Transcript_24377:144-506(-)
MLTMMVMYDDRQDSPAAGNTEDDGSSETIDWLSWRGEKLTDNEKPFMVKPVRNEEWQRWIGEQKEEASVNQDAMVWISLRKDGRVRSSGKGSPNWQRFAQTIPVDKGAWGGFLDGMDGRV